MKPLEFFNPDNPDNIVYTFAVILTKHQDKWVLVRQKEKTTWELPAGHVEPGESVAEAACRELFEETGAIEYQIKPISSYRGEYNDKMVYGKLFYAEVSKFDKLPASEIAEKKLFKTIPDKLNRFIYYWSIQKTKLISK